MKVTALLVSHNGARWLPAVLSGLDGATSVPDALVAVDTGSTDGSAALVAAARGAAVVELPASTTYADAIRAGLAAAGSAEPDEWVWLLHDDANPAPDCLELLVEAARTAPDHVAILGPKIREWPSLKRLLEVGVTLSGTGQRETGLERGEYDQGQHDEQHPVLAVNTAGMLVRRDLLEHLGLDPRLAVLGGDLDFGWRAARAGFTCEVVPRAVLFHVEASRRGVRDSTLVEHPRRQERAAALYTLLANSSGAGVPLRVLRMVVGGLLRAVGLLLVRAPREAADELLALADVLGRPGRIRDARKERARQHVVPHQQVRPLLAPFWLPLRHGLDFVSDVAVALADTVREAAERRRGGEPEDDWAWWLRPFRRPATWLLVAITVCALVAGRELLGGGSLQGGALLPAPEGVGHWWSTWAARWHLLGTGTDLPGPAYLLPLAAGATLLFGQTDLLLTLLFLLAVPISLLGALRFFRRIVPTPWAPLWAAAAYSLLPVLSGAVQQGRLGTVVAAVVLPWLATAALGLVSPDEERSWRAAWRTALAAGLLVAFVPTAWLLVLVLVFAALLTRWGRDHGRHLLVVVLLPVALVLPWAVGTNGVPAAWLVEAGKAAALRADPGVWDLLLGRAGGPAAAPAWLSVGLLLAGLAALLRRDTRTKVTQAWMVVAASALLLAMISRVPVSLPGVPEDFRPYHGFLLLVIQAGLVAAAALAAGGVLSQVASGSFSWRQPVAGIAVAAAVLTPVLGAGWWVLNAAEGPLTRDARPQLPRYMTDLATETDEGGVLVLRGGPRSGIDYRLLRSGPLRLGDDGVLALTEPDPRVRDLIESLLGSSAADDAQQLASYGVHYVYAPAPVSGSVSGGLDAAGGFGGASAPSPGTRAWLVEPDATLESVDRDRAEWRPLWILLQLLAVVGGIVLALPDRLTLRSRR